MFVLTDRDALLDLGVQLDESAGRLIYPVVQNGVSVPSVSEGLEQKKVKEEEERLKTKGFSLMPVKYIALQTLQTLGQPLVCGACQGK